ncbi:glycosyltransferase [Sinomonas gamaensis]|uniref:glycosyltransferase n=1 Tax=Sinomonas gamaensis TaxID=2565624 RepID=UPI0011085B16|nr:glycosyltransferase [Sinomonas gamaensis]
MIPTLSIITVTYNAGPNLDTTLESIKELKRALHDQACSLEFVAIDGNSSDDTVEVLRRSELPDVLVTEPDAGIYDAMNKGAALASGHWIHFLNAGDYIIDIAGYVELLSCLQKTDQGAEDAWWVSGALNLAGGAGTPTRIPNTPHSWFNHVVGLQPHCHQACWFRRDIFNALGGHDLQHGTAADYAFIVKCGMVARPRIFDKELIGYLGGGVSEIGPWKNQLLLHRVRRSLFNYRPVATSIDLTASTAIAVANAAKIATGRALRRAGLR